MTSPIDRIRPTSSPRRTVTDLAVRFDLQMHGSGCDAEIWSVASDDRTVSAGDLFVALPGARAHGAQFAEAALRRGAHAVLTDETGAGILPGAEVPVLVCEDPRALLGPVAAWVYGAPAERLTTFAVTGTNGKTTTTYMVDHVLRALGWTTGLIGTIETRAGDRVLPSRLTTPEAADLQAVLAAMVEADVHTLVMEVSSHALSMHRVDGLAFDVAGFTNLSQDHLDYHGTLESYFQAKAQLFTPAHSRRGVVLVDDRWGREMAAQAEVPVSRLSIDGGEAEWRVEDVTAGPHGTTFTLVHSDGRRLTTSTSLPGHFNLSNAALAVTMVLEAGADVRDLAEALDRCGGVNPIVPGRMELIAGPGPRVIVDFAHNPDAMAAAMRALRPTTSGKLHIVFGATGERDRGKRPTMGELAVQYADVVVVTDDDPHGEDASVIRSEVMAGADAESERRSRRGDQPVRVVEIAPRAPAIARAIAAAEIDDTVLIAGRGHETFQEINGVDYPLDDREEARAALARWVPPAHASHTPQDPSTTEHMKESKA